MGRKLQKLLAVSAMSLCLSLCACGGEGEEENNPTVQSQETLLILDTRTEECVYLQDVEGDTSMMGAQFRQGEIKQFWRVVKEEPDGNRSMDIYLCGKDGSRELIFENVDTSFGAGWYLDVDGNYFILQQDAISKVDKAGNLFFRQQITQGFAEDICQLSDGRVFMLYRDEEGKSKILSMDANTGALTEMPHIVLNEDISQFISGGDDGELLWMNEDSIISINPDTGAKTEVMPLAEYHYAPGTGVRDFILVGENAAQILYSKTCDVVEVEDIGKTRTIIHAKARDLGNKFLMQDCMAEFNHSNKEYYLVLDMPGDGTDIVNFITKTDVEIGTGGGPDLIFYSAVSEPESLANKGAFADLRPYIEQSGLKEEDFFSAAFGFMKVEDAIYAACFSARPTSMWISEELLGDKRTPDIETLVDALLNYKEKAAFSLAWESPQVLDYFLTGTEDLWGMIDWEKNTCDFSGELFAKMLEAAKQYGFDRTKDYPHLSEPIIISFYNYKSRAELEQAGRIPIGYFFDEGCYPAINHTSAMFINNNSDEAHKQGAWEFIEYLLSADVQMQLDARTVSCTAYDMIVEREMEEGPISITVDARGQTTKTYKAGSISAYGNDEEAYRAANMLKQVTADELRDMLENSKAFPTKTAPLLAIIIDEASSYFSGSKSADETIAVIENRVGLYLEEHRTSN